MAAAGLGDDLLLANEIVDARPARARWPTAARASPSRSTREATVDAAAARRHRAKCSSTSNVGLPRCGCAPDDAGRLADARARRGLDVRGVMGYEGHVVGIADRAERAATDRRRRWSCCARRTTRVGGDVVSAGGTGTYDLNTVAHRDPGRLVRADGHRLRRSSACRSAARCASSRRVISTSKPSWAVADCGLKALGMDHGNPTIDGAEVLFCSDEHVTFAPAAAARASATACACGPRTSTRPSRTTSACTSPTATSLDATVDRHLGGRPPRLERRGRHELSLRERNHVTTADEVASGP